MPRNCEEKLLLFALLRSLIHFPNNLPIKMSMWKALPNLRIEKEITLLKLWVYDNENCEKRMLSTCDWGTLSTTGKPL